MWNLGVVKLQPATNTLDVDCDGMSPFFANTGVCLNDTILLLLDIIGFPYYSLPYQNICRSFILSTESCFTMCNIVCPC